MAGQYNSRGGKILVGDGGSPTEAFTSIGNVIDFNGPTLSNPRIDVTNLDSAAREYLPDLPESGQVTANVHNQASSTQHQQLFADLNAGTSRNYRQQLSTTTEPRFDFNAFVEGMPFSGGVGNAVQFALTLTINGAVSATWS